MKQSGIFRRTVRLFPHWPRNALAFMAIILSGIAVAIVTAIFLRQSMDSMKGTGDVLGSYLVFTGEMSIGAWTGYYFLMNYTNSIFAYLPMLISGFKQMRVSADRILTLLDFPVERGGEAIRLPDGGDPLVEFRDVRFAYGGATEQALIGPE